MSDIFAKLFDFDGYQVLVTCDDHAETEAPIVTIRTQFSGLNVSSALSFPISDAGEEKRDEAFAMITREKADKYRAALISELHLSELSANVNP